MPRSRGGLCSTPGLYPDTVLRYQPIEFDDCGFFGFNRLRRGIDNRRVRSPARLRCCATCLQPVEVLLTPCPLRQLPFSRRHHVLAPCFRPSIWGREAQRDRGAVCSTIRTAADKSAL